MKVLPTGLDPVLLIEPQVFGDERGWFLETWRAEYYADHGIGPAFVQANASRSTRGVLRGLHYQWPDPQGKLVWVTEGRVLDVAVDIRPGSPDFGRWTAHELSVENHHQLWVPEGFAHGFQVLSSTATFNYLCTRPYRPDSDAAIAWDDPDIGIDWPIRPPDLSARDASAPGLRAMPRDRLPARS